MSLAVAVSIVVVCVVVVVGVLGFVIDRHAENLERKAPGASKDAPLHS
jgi:hypothetical protein